MFCRMYEKILFFGAYLRGREWTNLDNHHEQLQKPPQYPFNYCFSASICRASYEPLNKNPAFDRSYAMPCGRMSDEVSVFHSVPSAAACDPESGRFWVPATPQIWLPPPKWEHWPIRPSLSPHRWTRRCRWNNTVNAHREKAGSGMGGGCIFVSTFLRRCPHVSQSQHLRIILCNSAWMRFHANLNLPWKKHSREEEKSAWWSAKRLMQIIKANVSSVSLVISTYLLIRFVLREKESMSKGVSEKGFKQIWLVLNW